MATRIRRRRRKPHPTTWHKIAIPVVIVLGLIAAGGAVAAAWALNVYNEAPPLKDLKPVQKGRTSAIYSADGKLIDYAIVRLPDGQTMMTFLDVTESANYQRVLKERNDAPPGRTCWRAASRSRAPRRSPSSWSATSTSATRKTRSSARSKKRTWPKSSSKRTAAGGSSTPT